MTEEGIYEIGGAQTDGELEQIVALQRANHVEVVGAEERVSQGFVSLRHDVGLLREMGERWPHVVARVRGTGEVAGYALVMERRFRERFALLEPMFERLEVVEFEGRGIEAYRWYVMGQVCVGAAHRGRGLVERMYEGHRAQMGGEFDLMITEIARTNTRSLRAHEKAGCVVIDEYGAEDGSEWVVIALDLRGGAGRA